MIAYMRMYPKGVPFQASNEGVTRFSQEWNMKGQQNMLYDLE